MPPLTRWLLVPVLLAAWPGAAARAQAPPPSIRDEGKFFSEEARQKANQKIQDISRRYKRDLVIETYATVPEGRKDQVKADKKGFFHTWARERAKTLGVDGIYILI